MGEREEVKGHSWVGRECQGAGACRLEAGGGPAGGEGKLTRWHGMWCRAVKGAGIGGEMRGRANSPAPLSLPYHHHHHDLLPLTRR